MQLTRSSSPACEGWLRQTKLASSYMYTTELSLVLSGVVDPHRKRRVWSKSKVNATKVSHTRLDTSHDHVTD